MPNLITPQGVSSQVDDWELTRQWVEAETGMDLSGSRVGRLQDAVIKCLGSHDPESVLRGMRNQPERRIGFLEDLTTQLTIGESYFFRNEHHFKALREIVLPQIIAEDQSRREIHVWSAGCATGEEPYSLAILLDQLLGDSSGWRCSILGTDLNPGFLQRARAGTYRQWSFRQTMIHQDRTYFTAVGDSYCLTDRVRERVRFACLNLVKDVYPSPLTGTVGLDLIVFRNVAIYLKPEVTAAILRRFYEALRPGGWLLLGETEVAGLPSGDFNVRHIDQATFFQKAGGRGTVLASCPPALLPPALAGVSTSSQCRVANLPVVPEWVPLPRRRDGAAGRGTTAAADKSGEVFVEDQLECMIDEGRLDHAEQAVDRIVTAKERAGQRLKLARLLLRVAEPARARRLLEASLNEEPMLFEAQLLKMELALQAGDHKLAEQSCRRALYINPQAVMAHFHMALVLERKGDLAGVSRSLKATLKLLDGKDPHSLVEFGEGVCHGRLKEMVMLMMSK